MWNLCQIGHHALLFTFLNYGLGWGRLEHEIFERRGREIKKPPWIQDRERNQRKTKENLNWSFRNQFQCLKHWNLDPKVQNTPRVTCWKKKWSAQADHKTVRVDGYRNQNCIQSLRSILRLKSDFWGASGWMNFRASSDVQFRWFKAHSLCNSDMHPMAQAVSQNCTVWILSRPKHDKNA